MIILNHAVPCDKINYKHMKPSSLNWLTKRYKNHLPVGRQKDMFIDIINTFRMRVTHKELILIGICELHRLRRCRFAEHQKM